MGSATFKRESQCPLASERDNSRSLLTMMWCFSGQGCRVLSVYLGCYKCYEHGTRIDECSTGSLPDQLINPEEYEPVLPTTEEHTAAEPTDPDNEG